MISKKKLYLKYISRRIFWTEFILYSLIFGSLSGFLFYLSDILTTTTSNLNINKIYPPDLQNLFVSVLKINDIIPVYVIPALLSAIFILTLISWAIIKTSLNKKLDIIVSSKPVINTDKTKTIDPEMEKRKFLHLLSVLQEDGRLLDFLSEDLNSYEDDEIGAAVRSIHKGCKDGIEKYLQLEPVIEEKEDEEMDIPGSFNPDKIKLTGNVVGNPPFKGIVRHRGWKVKNFNLPELKKKIDASVIVPAEVEIQ